MGIAIETNGVFLDLNGMTISQSPAYHRAQRFFSIIELGSKPFQAKTGPPQFSTSSESLLTVNGVVVTGGSLGRSSHMGVHGNAAQNVWLHNLHIRDFETGGIQINGGKHI